MTTNQLFDFRRTPSSSRFDKMEKLGPPQGVVDNKSKPDDLLHQDCTSSLEGPPQPLAPPLETSLMLSLQAGRTYLQHADKEHRTPQGEKGTSRK
jgi:hypothetical protein